VVIKEFASGICHSQLHTIHGPRRSDVVLGHEATGEVVAIGDAVQNVSVGDKVLLTFQPRNMRDTDRMPWMADLELGDGSKAKSSNIFTWATHTIADDQYVIPIPADTPTDVTSIVGCAVLTGAGAVIRAAAVQPGESVAIWGVGGVGLNAVAAARMAGADPIIAVDLDDAKLALATAFGATHVINGANQDAVAEVKALTPGPPNTFGFRGGPIAGVDYAFDVVANQHTFDEAFRATRNGRNAVHGGGTTVVVGVPQQNFELPAVSMLINEQRVVGTIGGTSLPDDDIPQYLQWYRDGNLDLDALVTSRVGLDEINEATKMLDDGKVLGRTIIEIS
jgi:Zn-dependent alcohol dehydrogenase